MIVGVPWEGSNYIYPARVFVDREPRVAEALAASDAGPVMNVIVWPGAAGVVVTIENGAAAQIEADAALIMFIYRDGANFPEPNRPGEADLISAKHRNGPVGEIVLAFQKQFPRFLSCAGERYGG